MTVRSLFYPPQNRTGEDIVDSITTTSNYQPHWYVNTTPIYDFIVVGERLFKVNRYTGQAWYQEWTKWVEIKGE